MSSGWLNSLLGKKHKQNNVMEVHAAEFWVIYTTSDRMTADTLIKLYNYEISFGLNTLLKSKGH